MSSTRFVVGVNDGLKLFDKKGKPYEKVHIESCGKGRQIGAHRKFFADCQKALDFSADGEPAACCEKRIRKALGITRAKSIRREQR